jgi:hypothetical protein
MDSEAATLPAECGAEERRIVPDRTTGMVFPPSKRSHHGFDKRHRRHRYDRRTRIGRRVRALVMALRGRLHLNGGPLDPLLTAQIERCAETIAISEALRARAMRGEPIAADDVVRASRSADFLTRQLLAKAEPSMPSLGDLLGDGDGGVP